MDIGASSWLVILLAIAGANLPFFNDKVFAVFALKGATGEAGQPWHKPLLARLGEMAVLYALVGGIAVALENRIGGVFPQTWEFYAITACFFLVLAFPGFTVRYLLKHRHTH
ncbi:DUF2818 family protein [Duganella sp. FT92W]|uniref:DUF2818 family protein n=1 Tax=Pseudoduganella rivuli TaxID=2666085 RepID=A0A7X2ITP2_9BURK|nr:DUF2818 family protein [Pseudoduganella rivuli]MRV75940.1 DUF2818 family protein [Pseudoduganella rivuli]